MSTRETDAESTCEQILLHMSCALDGALAEHEKAGLSAHLETCALCRAQALAMRPADALFRVWVHQRVSGPVPGANFSRQLMARVRLEAPSAGGVLAFTRMVAQDPSLQSQFRPAASVESLVELFVSVGWARGYRFGRGEVVSMLAARRAANDDLSDAQLGAVVGGAGPGDAALHAFLGDVLQNWFKPPF